MKICYFNYFLKPKEKIFDVFNCKLKSITPFQMINEDGVLVATNSRLVFCKVIGEHPHALQSYEYKYITNLSYKDEMYLYFKHNGDVIKITDMKKDAIDKLLHIIDKRDLKDILI